MEQGDIQWKWKATNPVLLSRKERETLKSNLLTGLTIWEPVFSEVEKKNYGYIAIVNYRIINWQNKKW